MTALYEGTNAQGLQHRDRALEHPSSAPRRGRFVDILIVWLIGTVFCVAVATAPEVVPRLVGKPGYAWTPFNSSNFRVGDFYYYAPWVRQIIRRELPLRPPTAGDNASAGTVENVRSLPYFVAALPGLFLLEFRSVLLADIALSATLFFLAFYAIALILLGQPWPAFAAAILAYFYSGIWQAAGHNVQFLSALGLPGSVPAWYNYSLTAAAARIRVLLDPTEYDFISDAFRFVNLSISGPLLSLQLLMCLALFKRFSLPKAIGLFVVSLPLAFSYPSHPVVGYVTMICLAAAALFRRYWKEFFGFVVAGCAVIAVLLVIGYPELVRRSVESTAMLQSLYIDNGIKLGQVTPARLVDTILFNKYLISTVVLAALFYDQRRLRAAVIAIGTSVTVVSCVTLLDPPDIWQRFLARGIELPWGAFVAAGVVRFFLLARDALPQSRGRVAAHISGVLAVVILCVVPATGFARFALRNEHNLTRFVTEDRWSTYTWIADHVPSRAVVATLDWDDMVFLPMYTNASLVAGHTDLSGRTPEQQLRRFVGLWKLLGRSRDQLEQFVTRSIPAFTRRPLGDLRNPPLNTEEDYPCAEFAAGLLYWPYIKLVDGIQIADSAMKLTNPAFTRHVLTLYDQTDSDLFREQADITFVLGPPDQKAAIAAFPEAELVFQNTTRSLYRVGKVTNQDQKGTISEQEKR